MSDYKPADNLDTPLADARIAVVAARFNGAIVEGLLAGARRVLANHGVKHVQEVCVPGAFEIPLMASKLATTQRFDGVITLGAVIRGDTAHFEFVAGECARGLQRVMLDSGIPVGFGVLTCDTQGQALDRAGSNQNNKGGETALAVLEMIAELRRLHSAAGQ